MRHVPLSEFQINVSEFVAAVRAGEDVVITQDGHDPLRLSRVSDDRMARQREAVNALAAIGQDILRKNGPTTAVEIHEWIEDGRP